MQRAFLFIVFLGIIVALPASAHVNGVSFEKEKDGYTIDAGYGAPAPAVGESLLLDFRLRKEGKDVDFSDAWIKITSETGAVVFASGIHNAEFGGPRMSYVFPKAGKYEISMRFENGSKTLVEDSFPITVIPAAGTGLRLFGFDIAPVLCVLAGVLVGAVGGVLAGRIRSKKGTTAA